MSRALAGLGNGGNATQKLRVNLYPWSPYHPNPTRSSDLRFNTIVPPSAPAEKLFSNAALFSSIWKLNRSSEDRIYRIWEFVKRILKNFLTRRQWRSWGSCTLCPSQPYSIRHCLKIFQCDSSEEIRKWNLFWLKAVMNYHQEVSIL